MNVTHYYPYIPGMGQLVKVPCGIVERQPDRNISQDYTKISCPSCLDWLLISVARQRREIATGPFDLEFVLDALVNECHEADRTPFRPEPEPDDEEEDAEGGDAYTFPTGPITAQQYARIRELQERPRLRQGFQYLGAGTHTLRVDRVHMHQARPLPGSTEDRAFFIAEFTVLTSTNTTHQAGEQRSWLCRMGTPYTVPNIRAFVLAIAAGGPVMAPPIAHTADDLTPEAMRIIVDEHMLEGHHVRAVCLPHVTLRGAEFTRVEWRPV